MNKTALQSLKRKKAGSLAGLILLGLGLLGVIGFALLLAMLPKNAALPAANIKRECLGVDGKPLTENELIHLATMSEAEVLTPPREVLNSSISWTEYSSENYRGDEYSEYGVKRDERGRALGLKRWAVVSFRYHDELGGEAFLSVWYDACGNRFG